MSSQCPNCRLLELKSKKNPFIVKNVMWIFRAPLYWDMGSINCTECLKYTKFNLKVGHFLFHLFCSFRKVKILWTEIFCNSNTNIKYDLRNYRLVNVKGASCHPDGTCIL